MQTLVRQGTNIKIFNFILNIKQQWDTVQCVQGPIDIKWELAVWPQAMALFFVLALCSTLVSTHAAFCYKRLISIVL